MCLVPFVFLRHSEAVFEFVEAAGIEHFVESNKTTRYGSAVPKSCLKKLTGFGYLRHAYLGYLKAGEVVTLGHQ